MRTVYEVFYFLQDEVDFENRRQAAILLLITFPYSSLIICFMFLYYNTELFVERFLLWRAAFLDIMCLRGVKGGGGESSEPWDTLPTLWKAWKEDLIFDGMSHSGDRGVTASTRRCVCRVSFLSHRKGGITNKGGHYKGGERFDCYDRTHRVHRVAMATSLGYFSSWG